MIVILSSQARHSLIFPALVGFALLVCLGFVLVACGSSPTASGSYIYTDNTQVELLSWKSDNNGKLTGQWNGVSYQLPLSRNSQPLVSQPVSLTGTTNNETIQLTGSMLSFQGTVSNSLLRGATNLSVETGKFPDSGSNSFSSKTRASNFPMEIRRFSRSGHEYVPYCFIRWSSKN